MSIFQRFTFILIYCLSPFVFAKTNVFTDSQTSYGNWRPDKFLEQGWSGYQIVSRFVKQRAVISWDCGDKCTDYYYQCPDGDCQYTEETQFFKITDANGRDFQRVPIGKVNAYDHGSIEQRRLNTNNDVTIALINETENQSAAKFDESQIQTFIGFDKNGTNEYELGHIEEADAPNLINQPESLYQRIDGKDQFLTTVIERVLVGTNGDENIRLATLWCDSDEFKLNKNTFVRFFQGDRFNMKQCGGEKTPILSDTNTSIGGFLKQALTSRSSSTVTLKNPTDRKQSLRYDSDSDVSVLFNNGTDYKVAINGSNQLYINSETYQSMGNSTRSFDGSLEVNYPKIKFVTVNWNHQKKFEGVKEEAWLDSSKNGSATALIAFEKIGEIYTQLDGKTCSYGDGWASMTIHDASGHSVVGEEAKAKICKPSKRYDVNMYILFPPTINGQTLTEEQKVALLDQALALMPDQTQSSSELAASEEYLDEIRAFEKFEETKDPSSIGFPLMVDIGTEEDHITTQEKAWDFFAKLGFVQPVTAKVPSNDTSANKGTNNTSTNLDF